MRYESLFAAVLIAGLAVGCGDGDTNVEGSGGGLDASSAGDAKDDASDASTSDASEDANEDASASDASEDASEDASSSDASEDASEDANADASTSDASEDASDAGGDAVDAEPECVVGSVVCEGDILVKCPNGKRVETDCAASGQSCHAQMGHCM